MRVRSLTTLLLLRSLRRGEGYYYTEIDRGLVFRGAGVIPFDLLFNGILAPAQGSMGSRFHHRCNGQSFDCGLSATLEYFVGRSAFSGRESGQKQLLATRFV